MVRLGWLVALVAAAAVVVIAAAAPAGAREGCGVPAAPSWTATERAVWRQLCAGQLFDFNSEAQTVEENLDPHQPGGWDETRVLSSAFVEQLLDEPYAPVIDRHGIFLGGAWFPGGLDIHEATIGFPLRCQFCRIAGMQAYDAVIDGDFDLQGSAIEGDLTLLGADLRSDLYVSGGSVVSGTLNADRLTVAGDVFLDGGSRFAGIRLLGAGIGGQLAVDEGSVVSGTLAADGLTVAGDVFLDVGSRFADIDLLGAEVGGLILLNGARWEPGGSLDLRQADVGGVSTDERADSLPQRLELDGFTFEQWANPDPRDLGAGWFLGTWLGRGEEFSPGPYDRLAAVMDAGGHPTIAADIRYHRSDEERLVTPWTRPERWGRMLHWLVLGYGYRPWWALGWFFAAWVTGFFVLWLRPGARAGLARLRPVPRGEWSVGQAALFSLDRLVPAVSLADPDGFPPRTRAQQLWSV